MIEAVMKLVIVSYLLFASNLVGVGLHRRVGAAAAGGVWQFGLPGMAVDLSVGGK